MRDIIIDAPTLHIRHIHRDPDCDVMTDIVLGGIMVTELPEELKQIPQNEKVRIIIQREGKIA